MNQKGYRTTVHCSFFFFSFFFCLFFAATGRNANVARKRRQYLRSRFNCFFARILRQRKRRIGCRNRIAWETKSLSLLTAGAPSNCFLQNICSEKPKLPRIFYSSRIRNMFGKLLRSAPNELGYRSVLGRTWIDKITISIYIYLLESGAPNENIVQNHLNIQLLNVF